jgi:hypothetical protein
LEARPQDLGEEERSESPWNELPWIGTDLLLPVIIELAILCAILSTSFFAKLLFTGEKKSKRLPSITLLSSNRVHSYHKEARNYGTISQ